MAGYHSVSQGEHVCGIAANYGFSDYKTIWNHPNNADLKKLRQNPNVLYPGDSLFIPDREIKEYPRATDQSHKFKRKGTTLKLRLTLQDQYEKPIANATCVLTVGAESRTITSDGSGKINETIPFTASECLLLIQDAEQTPYGGAAIPIKIGHLDPIDEISGQQGRLSALGYYWGPIDGLSSPDFLSAVEEFQCEHDLTVDGICGKNTQAKLKQVHGS
jgi:N-acetylmuramoyl-L-alanine amidase